MLFYRGYTTLLQQDLDTHTWHGRVMGIHDVITFEGSTLAEAEQRFRHSVDVYLNFCQTLDRVPEQPTFPNSSDCCK